MKQAQNSPASSIGAQHIENIAFDQTEQKSVSAKTKAVIFWIATGLLSLGMLSGGIGQLLRAKFNVDGMIHLGYPLYVMSIVGAWKILGIIAILVPGKPLLKEWAYAGLFFAMSGAVVSHIASGDGFAGFVAPLVFMILTVVSWWLRPAGRKLSVL